MESGAGRWLWRCRRPINFSHIQRMQGPSTASATLAHGVVAGALMSTLKADIATVGARGHVPGRAPQTARLSRPLGR